MALKPLRKLTDDTIDFYMNVTADRGLIVIHDTAGSGQALDQSVALVAVPTGQAVSTTQPAGLLMCDVVNYDLTRQSLNQHKFEVQIGGKVQVARKGVFVTDKISGTPTGTGKTAYYTNTGLLTETDPGNGPPVGRFLSKKDNDGYAKVDINIHGYTVG